MKRMITTLLPVILLIMGATLVRSGELLPVPARLIVLTFDDGNKSDVEFVALLLKQYGFGATFFVSDCDWFRKDKQTYMTWEEVRKLHDMGFEVGNHTRSHPNLAKLPVEAVAAEVEAIEQLHRDHGLPRPTSFCYPGYKVNRAVVGVLIRKGYRFARRGVGPEYPYSGRGDCGPAYDPADDHPLLVPTTGAWGPDYTWEDFLWTVSQAKDGKIAVLTLHGVPDVKHPWVNTDPAVFQRCMKYLKDHNYTVIALRDLAKYVDPSKGPGDPFAPIERRVPP
ncbi:MAG: polysaccharide deacetylase family protein [Verrucomicrobia bacterium]|nr:polysaccharide deacetylase family protein [Verrucomicrobiota bacterium]